MILPPLRPILSALLRHKTGALLIALQVALTLAILCNALFIVHERLQQSRAPSGVAEDSVFFVTVHTPGADAAPFDVQRRDENLIRAIPGVRHASWANQVPLGQSGENTSVSSEPNGRTSFSVAIYAGGVELLPTLGLRLVDGRGFTADEELDIDRRVGERMPGQVIITQALARRMFAQGGSAVGRSLHAGGPQGERTAVVVGVVERLVTPWGPVGWNPDDPAGEHSLILPARMESRGTYLVRAEPARLNETRRQVVAALKSAEPGRIVLSQRSMQEVRALRYRGDTYLAGLLMVVIAALLTMTAGGIVGLASLRVTQRRKQIGVRRALGARRGDIVRHFLAENLMVTAFGTVAGLSLAVALNHVLTRFTTLQPLPLAVLLAGALLMLVLGAAAVLGPALRAARIAPAEATRSV
jgi:putative ABC transport system permease protein